jgi:hypothetical protein
MVMVMVRLMVDVDLIPPKPLHTYCNNRFALQIYTHNFALILNTHIFVVHQNTNFMINFNH